MIWYFLAGWISGVIGTIMYANWWIRRHSTRVSAEEMIQELEDAMKEEEKSND